MFRQNRDVRFSPDKSPYKTTTYGILYEVAVPGDGLYAQLSARGLYAGTGYYRMARDQLERYREAVAGDAGGPGWRRRPPRPRRPGSSWPGDSLRTAPRGYPRDHPRIELLRRKELIAGRAASGEGGIDRDAALDARGGHLARGRADQRVARRSGGAESASSGGALGSPVTKSAATRWRRESARNGSASAEIPAPSR